MSGDVFLKDSDCTTQNKEHFSKKRRRENKRRVLLVDCLLSITDVNQATVVKKMAVDDHHFKVTRRFLGLKELAEEANQKN